MDISDLTINNVSEYLSSLKRQCPVCSSTDPLAVIGDNGKLIFNALQGYNALYEPKPTTGTILPVVCLNCGATQSLLVTILIAAMKDYFNEKEE